jgi:hypothetical protein
MLFSINTSIKEQPHKFRGFISMLQINDLTVKNINLQNLTEKEAQGITGGNGTPDKSVPSRYYWEAD